MGCCWSRYKRRRKKRRDKVHEPNTTYARCVVPLAGTLRALHGLRGYTNGDYKRLFVGATCVVTPKYASVGEACRATRAPYLMVVYDLDARRRPFAQARTYRQAWRAEVDTLSRVAREDIGPGVVEIGSVRDSTRNARVLVVYRWQGTLHDYLQRHGRSLRVCHVYEIAAKIKDLVRRLHETGTAHGAFGFDNILYSIPHVHHMWVPPDLCLVNFADATTAETPTSAFGLNHEDLLAQERTLADLAAQTILNLLRFRYGWAPVEDGT